MSLLVITTLAAALAQPRWLSIKGGPCRHSFIGLQKFICFKHSVQHLMANPTHHSSGGLGNIRHTNVRPDKPESLALTATSVPVKIISETNESDFNTRSPLKIKLMDELAGRSSKVSSRNATAANRAGHQVPLITERYVDLKHFASPEIVRLQGTIFAFCFLAGVVNLFQFFLDTLGTDLKSLDSFRRNALGNLLGVICCIIVIGLTYVVSDIVERDHTKIFSDIFSSSSGSSNGYMAMVKGNGASNWANTRVEVRFEMSFYLIALAGLLGLIAASCNLFKKPKIVQSSTAMSNLYPDQESNTLLDERWSSLWPASSSISSMIPPPIHVPPPPYTPYYNPPPYASYNPPPYTPFYNPNEFTTA